MALFTRGSNPIGSMFTGGGMTPGQTIGRAYADFGKTIGGVGSAVGDVIRKRTDEQKQQRLSEETRKVLEQYAGNPTGLLAKGQELLTSNDPKMAQIGQRFITIAESRISQQTTADERTLAGLKSQVTAGARQGLKRNDPKMVALRTKIEAVDKTGAAFEDAYLKGSPTREVVTLSEGERAAEITMGPEGATSRVIEDPVTASKDLKYETKVDENGVITVVEINPNTSTSRVISEHQTTESALKQQQRLEAEANRLTKARMTRNTVNETIDFIEDNINKVDKGILDGIGGFSQLLAVLPGSEAKNLEALVSTIKANVGFDQLLSIKAAGSTLGQVSNIENALLQSTIASLDTLRDPQEIIKSLKKIRGYYNSMITKARLVEKHGKNDVPTITWLQDTNWTDANFVDAWREDFGGEVKQNPDGSYIVTMPEDDKGQKDIYHIIQD